MIIATAGQTIEATTLPSVFATGLAGTIGVRLLDNQGNTPVTRTTANIIELVSGSGVYACKALVMPATTGQYTLYWDDAAFAVDTEDVVIADTANTVLAATAPASTNPLSFTIKRGDTDPSIVAQALYTNPANTATLIPWPIPGGSTVKFTMRDSADFAARTRTAFAVTTPKVHATASIDDAANGIMSYGWAVGDTDTDGLFRAEFEVTSGSEIRTFPVGTDDTRNWIAVTIVDDLDPGINP